MVISRSSDSWHQGPGTGSGTPGVWCEQHGLGFIGLMAVVLKKKDRSFPVWSGSRELAGHRSEKAASISRP